MASLTVFMFFTAFSFSEAKEERGYSNNAICLQRNCINPIFPGMEDLRRLEATQLQCQPSHEAKNHMKFCKNAVYYDIALPSPSKTGNATTLESVVMLQDNAAATSYYYHLAGMNVEGWEHRNPEEGDNDCTKAIWRMVCHTYFPRAEAGCKQGEASKHMRPCKNVCTSFIQACDVECCDESVNCIFQKKVSLVDGSETTVSGYHDESGPSAECTGSGASRKSPSVIALLVASFAFLQFLLPGCESTSTSATKGAKQSFRLPSIAKKCVMGVVLVAICSNLQGCFLGQLFAHRTPAWQEKQSYWDTFRFIPPFGTARDPDKLHNSCSVGMEKSEQCGGHGVCVPWQSKIPATGGGITLSFCKCYRDWADPECRTKRKSQFTAYFLSLFFGIFGADHFYLVSYFTAFAKLATLGGFGFWWIYDIVRLGASPVYADEYRLAYDLPHWMFVLVTVLFFSCVGFIFFVCVARADKFEQAKTAFMHHEEEEHQHVMHDEAHAHEEDAFEMRTPFASYPLPMNQAMIDPNWPEKKQYFGPDYGAVPTAVKQSGALNPFSPYAVFQHATEGYMGPPGKYNYRAMPTNPAAAADFTMRANQQCDYEYGY